jgi:ABC-type branched-subunit amino acid transport system ATPase component
MNRNIIESIKKHQDDYYSKSNVKTIFNKTELKKGCVNFISQNIQNIDLDNLISETVFIVTDTNKIFIDYIVFKTFASQMNYQSIVDSLDSKILFLSSMYQTFEVHLNR